MIKKLRNIFQHLTKVQIVTLVVLIVLLLSLPIAIFLTRQQQEIRPRAVITGQANFHLLPAPVTGTPAPALLPPNQANAGDEVHATVIMDLTSPTVRASGVDFRVLFDKNKFDYIGFAIPAVPIGGSGPATFTDVVLKQENQPFDDTFNYTRIVLVSKSLTPQLPSGAGIYLGTLALRAKANGAGVIKFPDQNQDANGVDIMQVVGVDLSGGATNTPGGPTNTPGGPTNSPTLGGGVGAGTYDDRNAAISYASNWIDVNNVTGAYKSTLKRSKTANDTATLNFTGTAATVRLSEAQNRGKAEISIMDGGVVKATATVDTYGPPNSGLVWFGPYTVASGNHTLVIKVTHTKNPQATDFNVAFDAIKIQ